MVLQKAITPEHTLHSETIMDNLRLGNNLHSHTHYSGTTSTMLQLRMAFPLWSTGVQAALRQLKVWNAFK